MNLTEYQPLAVRTAKWYPSLFLNLQHASLGLLSEVGEFVSIAKRVTIYEKEFTPEMRAHALEELGDVAWYCALAAKTLNVKLDHITLTIIEVPTDLAHAAMLLGICIAPIVTLVEAQRESVKADDYLVRIKESLGMTISAVMFIGAWLDPEYDLLGANIEKLAVRYPEQYTDAAAEARIDKGGRDARVS